MNYSERLKAKRREAWFRRCFWICAVLIQIVLMVYIYLHFTRKYEPITGQIEYRIKAARLDVGQVRYEKDPIEDCLVFMRKDQTGVVTHMMVATHC